MTTTELLALPRTEQVQFWNDGYRAQIDTFAAELANTPTERVAADFGIATELAARLQNAIAGVVRP